MIKAHNRNALFSPEEHRRLALRSAGCDVTRTQGPRRCGCEWPAKIVTRVKIVTHVKIMTHVKANFIVICY